METLYKYAEDSNNFESILIKQHSQSSVERADFATDLYRMFKSSEPLAGTWKPLELEIDKGRSGPVSDFPSLPIMLPIFSARAWEILEPLIGSEVEALPVIHPRAPHVAIHVMKIIDGLDHAESKFKYYPSGNIDGILEYHWDEAKIKGHHMFHIPEGESDIYVSGAFRQTVESHGLKGLNFRRQMFGKVPWPIDSR